MGRHIFLAVNNSSPILFTQIVIMNQAKNDTTEIDDSVKKLRLKIKISDFLITLHQNKSIFVKNNLFFACTYNNKQY